jgi:flagellar hook-basal body complex protein FliE
MTASFQSAINAYTNTSRFKIDPQGVNNNTPANQVGMDRFTNAIKDTVTQTAQPLRHAEEMVAKSLMKQADISDVVSATTQAELMLQTIVNIRDRLVNAHQEILRMPI